MNSDFGAAGASHYKTEEWIKWTLFLRGRAGSDCSVFKTELTICKRHHETETSMWCSWNLYSTLWMQYNFSRTNIFNTYLYKPSLKHKSAQSRIMKLMFFALFLRLIFFCLFCPTLLVLFLSFIIVIIIIYVLDACLFSNEERKNWFGFQWVGR